MPNELIYQSEFSGQQMDERFRAVATLAEALTVLEQAIAAKYTKPADGIPSTDMDASVQSALALALTSVQSLADYYTKSEVDSIAAAIAATINATSGEVVASLPTASASTLSKIYYVGPTSGEYDRYVTSYDGTTYSWLQIGSTDVDMTQYATKDELNQLDQEVDEISVDVNGGESNIEITTLNANGYYGTNADPMGYGYSYAAGIYCCMLPVQPGEKYRITGLGGNQYARLWAITNAERTRTRYADVNKNTRTTPVELTIEQGEAYLYCNLSSYDSNTDSVVKKVTVPGLSNDVASLQSKVNDIQQKTIESEDLVPSLELVQDGATLTPTGTISSSQYTSDYKVMSLELSGEDFITLDEVYGGSGWSLACGYDADGNFVKSYGTATTGGSPASLTIVPESNIKTIKVTIHKSHLSSYKLVGYTYGIAFENFDTGATKTHTIYISPTDTGDDSLVGVLKTLSADTSSSKPSKKDNYLIVLEPGEYDMDCSDQVGTLPRGPFVPQYTTIKGAGRGVTFLKYIYEGTNDSVMSEHSVLNMPYTSTLEDVTAIAENIRYTIHSDMPEMGKSAEDSVVVLRNVELIHNGITNGETPTTNNPSAWGGGTLSGQVRKFYNCKFVAAMFTPFANHDRTTNTSAQYFEFENCEFEALRVNNSDLVTDYATPAILLNSWGSGVPVFVNFVNCYANKWVELYTNGDFDSDYQVKSDNELLFHIKENTANPQNKRHYITGGCREFIFPESTSKGTPVVMTDSRAARAAIASDARALIFGVLLHDVAAGDVGVVMRSGMFAVQQIIGSSFSAGDTIGWDGSAWDEVESDPIAVLLTDTIAILRV